MYACMYVGRYARMYVLCSYVCMAVCRYIYVCMHVGNMVCVYESYLMHVYKDNDEARPHTPAPQGHIL